MNESSLSRIWRHISKHDSGTISAFRYGRDCGNGERYTKKDNMDRNVILKAKLLTKGYSVTPIKGTYIENYGSDTQLDVDEDSFLVVDVKDSGKLKRDLMKLGEMFEQDSITYADVGGYKYYLIGTNKCPKSYPGYKKEKLEGKGIFGKKGQFHSKIGGRPFVFKSVSGNMSDISEYSIAEIRSIEHLSESMEDV